LKVLALSFLMLIGCALVVKVSTRNPERLPLLRDGVLGGRGVVEHPAAREEKPKPVEWHRPYR
jgi:hypothetical protein